MKHTTMMKLFIASAALGLMLQVAGCHSRVSHATEVSQQSESKQEMKHEAKLASKLDGKVEQATSHPTGQSDEIDLAEREEIRQSFPLSADARVSIRGINGLVNIETADIKTAEVYIVRSARQHEDLQYRQVKIEQTPNSLDIFVENRGERSVFFSLFSSPPEGHQRVMLKLPRQVELTANNVNGPVTVGEIAGAVRLNGINGRIKVAQASSSAVLAGINGSIEATISKLGGDGVHVNGVNGNIELRFADALNADLFVRGVNGRIDPDLPNLTMKGKQNRSNNVIAQIGTGGAPVVVSGVNGNVHLTSTAKASANASATAER